MLRPIRQRAWLIAIVVLIATIAKYLYPSGQPTRVSLSLRSANESFSTLPEYIRGFPFGAGLRSVGPAQRLVTNKNTEELDAENELNFLVIELGVPGLLVLTLFFIRLLALVATRLRAERDDELRLLLAAIAALLALPLTWIAGASTSTSLAAPYFCFAAGTLVYWLAACQGTSQPSSPHQLGERTGSAALVGRVGVV
jgi:hypothetical protein